MAAANLVHAPILTTLEQIETVVKAVAPKPVNVLIGAPMPFAVKDLAALGVRHAFCIVSIHNMPMLDAINRLGKTRLVDVRHEGAGTHAAEQHLLPKLAAVKTIAMTRRIEITLSCGKPPQFPMADHRSAGTEPQPRR